MHIKTFDDVKYSYFLLINDVLFFKIAYLKMSFLDYYLIFDSCSNYLN